MRKEFQIRSDSPAETERIANELADLLRAGDVITLSGDLGAGKTTFTQGVARGLGVKRHVNSPTFTLVKEYQGEDLPLIHMDMYRVENEFEELGIEEYLYGSGVCMIEWPQKIEGQLPKERLNIKITKLGDEERFIVLSPQGDRYVQLAEKLVEG